MTSSINKTEFVETPRLQLQPVTAAVITDLFKTKTEAEIMRFFGCESEGLSHYRDMYEKGTETFRLSFLSFVLVRKADPQAIGECGFHTWNKTHRRAEVFYHVHEGHKRQGYMKEALPAVLQYGFEVMKLHRVQALIDKANIPSFKLLMQTGFTHEGTLRQDYLVDGKNEDSECYSLLSHEWRERLI